MRVLVTGGHKSKARDLVFWALTALHAASPIERIAHGAAAGVDTFADEWALLNGLEPVRYPTLNWNDGKGAGRDRNGHMLASERDGLDLVIAFPGSRGTLDMTTKARAAGVPVLYVFGDGPHNARFFPG